jgi:hypothetical protein
MVKHCDTISNLPEIIFHQLNNFKYNHEELLQFMAALSYDTVSIDMVQLWYYERNFDKVVQGVEPLVDLIAKKINLKQS